MSQAIYDAKVKEILELLEAGQSKEEISSFYNQEWKVLYTFMHRKGFAWDSELLTFVEKTKQMKVEAPSIVVQNTKAAQIIRMLEAKHPDIKKAAIKHGFQTVEELGDYMKSQGYHWDDEKNNYIEDTTFVHPNEMSPKVHSSMQMNESAFLQFLMANQDQLIDLLQSEGASHLVTYKFKGNKVNKTLTLAAGAVTLLADYHNEFNMTQRLIVETALAEFFERHGYKDRLKAVTI